VAGWSWQNNTNVYASNPPLTALMHFPCCSYHIYAEYSYSVVYPALVSLSLRATPISHLVNRLFTYYINVSPDYEETLCSGCSVPIKRLSGTYMRPYQSFTRLLCLLECQWGLPFSCIKLCHTAEKTGCG